MKLKDGSSASSKRSGSRSRESRKSKGSDNSDLMRSQLIGGNDTFTKLVVDDKLVEDERMDLD